MANENSLFIYANGSVDEVSESDTFEFLGVMSLLNPIKLGEMVAVSSDVLEKSISSILLPCCHPSTLTQNNPISFISLNVSVSSKSLHIEMGSLRTLSNSFFTDLTWMKMPQLFWIWLRRCSSPTWADLLTQQWADNEFVFILERIIPLKWGLVICSLMDWKTDPCIKRRHEYFMSMQTVSPGPSSDL